MQMMWDMPSALLTKLDYVKNIRLYYAISRASLPPVDVVVYFYISKGPSYKSLEESREA
jgi:hypothetical protein